MKLKVESIEPSAMSYRFVIIQFSDGENLHMRAEQMAAIKDYYEEKK